MGGSDDTTRRNVLKSICGGAAAISGVTLASGTAAADAIPCTHPDAECGEISTGDWVTPVRWVSNTEILDEDDTVVLTDECCPPPTALGIGHTGPTIDHCDFVRVPRSAYGPAIEYCREYDQFHVVFHATNQGAVSGWIPADKLRPLGSTSL